VTDDAGALVRLIDDLEGRADGYLTLDDVERAAGRSLVDAVAAGLLLVDYRERIDAAGNRQAVTLARLNRHHPLVRGLTSW
jgi:hypothetical protein